MDGDCATIVHLLLQCFLESRLMGLEERVHDACHARSFVGERLVLTAASANGNPNLNFELVISLVLCPATGSAAKPGMG
jgi:hypothetical protein